MSLHSLSRGLLVGTRRPRQEARRGVQTYSLGVEHSRRGSVEAPLLWGAAAGQSCFSGPIPTPPQILSPCVFFHWVFVKMSVASRAVVRRNTEPPVHCLLPVVTLMIQPSVTASGVSESKSSNSRQNLFTWSSLVTFPSLEHELDEMCLCPARCQEHRAWLGAELAWTLDGRCPLLHTPLPFSPTHSIIPWVLRTLGVLGPGWQGPIGTWESSP